MTYVVLYAQMRLFIRWTDYRHCWACNKDVEMMQRFVCDCFVIIS